MDLSGTSPTFLGCSGSESGAPLTQALKQVFMKEEVSGSTRVEIVPFQARKHICIYRYIYIVYRQRGSGEGDTNSIVM